MAKQTNQYFVVGTRIAAVTLGAGDTTVSKAIIASGANDSVLRQFSAVNTSPDSAVIEIILNDGSTDFVLTTLTMYALAGSDGVIPAFDLLGLSLVYNAVMLLQAGWSIRARAKTTLTADIVFTAIVADY